MTNVRNFANFFAIIFGQFVAIKILHTIMNYFYSLIASKCNKDFINKISGLDTQHKAVMGEKEWHGEWERKSMTCYLGTGQTCHTCLIWHQGLYTNSGGFDLSQDTFIVLFAKISFDSRFWWNTPAVLQCCSEMCSHSQCNTPPYKWRVAGSYLILALSRQCWKWKNILSALLYLTYPEPKRHRPQPFI